MIPTGAADPYALRRTAQGIIQLILGLSLALNLEDLTSEAIRILNEQQKLNLHNTKLQENLLGFLLQRQRWFLQERGIRYDLIEAVLQNHITKKQPQESRGSRALPAEQLHFAEFLGQHLDSDIFKRSVEAIVRAENISKKYSNMIVEKIDESALKHAKEKKFFAALQPILNSDPNTRWTPEKFMKQLHSIEPVVTGFFEDVMVMDDDPVKSGNRLWLCMQLAKWSGKHLDLQALVFA